MKMILFILTLLVITPRLAGADDFQPARPHNLMYYFGGCDKNAGTLGPANFSLVLDVILGVQGPNVYTNKFETHPNGQEYYENATRPNQLTFVAANYSLQLSTPVPSPDSTPSRPLWLASGVYTFTTGAAAGTTIQYSCTLESPFFDESLDVPMR